MLRHCCYDRFNECQQTKWRRFCVECAPKAGLQCPGCKGECTDLATKADLDLWRATCANA
jgi:hypothetical protein